MALAMLGLVLGSALLLACILILLDRATRPRRASASHGHAQGSSGDSGWMHSMASDAGSADCGGGDVGGGDGGGGGD